MRPSSHRVLQLLKFHGSRPLPREAEINTRGHAVDDSLIAQLRLLGCRWEWSYAICRGANTADYRKRISELNQIGYVIVSFSAPFRLVGDKHTIMRHGYILIAEPAPTPSPPPTPTPSPTPPPAPSPTPTPTPNERSIT